MKRWMVLLLVGWVALAVQAEGKGKFPIQFLGAKVSTPQIFSVTLGYPFDHSSMDWSSSAWGLVLEPGVGGVKAGVASWGTDGFSGLCAKACVLRTYGEPVDVEADMTYVGAEVGAMCFGPSLTVGVYRRVAGDPDDSDWILSGGVGVGF